MTRTARVLLPLVVVMIGCASEGTGGDSVGRTAQPLTVPAGDPYLDFWESAPDSRDLALTFDDGPDEVGYTNQILDVLRAKGVLATFFINTDNAVDVNASSFARNTVERIVADGHELGSHTVHHYDLAKTSTDVRAELFDLRTTLREIAPFSLRHRLARAPFGSPYFGPQDRLDEVSPLMARDGVHVGWNIDSYDWKCQSGSSAPQTCIYNNVMDEVDRGKSGIVLLHSIHPATAGVLGKLIDGLRGRGKRFVGVEQLVVAKYGKGSRHLVRCQSNVDCSPGDVCGTDRRCAADGTEPPPPPLPPSEGGGWALAPEFPHTQRSGNAFAWIGGEAVAWGGVTLKGTFLESGAAYDPTRGTWRKLPSTPLSPRADVSFANNDHQLFVFGGRNDTYERMTSAMFYDSWTNAWTRLPNAPSTLRCAPRAVWAETTSELIVYGCVWSSSLNRYLVRGYAIDVATRTWRTIRPSPLTPREGFVLAWVSSRMVVWGGADIKNRGPNGTARNDGAAYDPSTDSWSSLATAPIGARHGASFATDGDRLFVLGGYSEGSTAQYADGAILEAGSWTPIPALPTAIARSAVFTDGNKLWSWGGLRGATPTADGYVYDPTTGTWSTLPASPLRAAAGANAAWTGSAGVVFGGEGATTIYDEAALFTP